MNWLFVRQLTLGERTDSVFHRRSMLIDFIR